MNCFDSNYYSTGEKFEMFVDIRCPIRVECILSCSTTSLTDFRANLSSLIKASLFKLFD